MARILVAFASSHGQTRAIAGVVASGLRARGHDVELADARATPPPPPTGYDAVILGSRVHNAAHDRSIVTYARAYAGELAAMPSAFFSVSLSAAQAGAGADPHAYLARLFTAVGWRPAHAVAVGGALRYRQYNWFLCQIMRLLARAGGHSTDSSRDHIYTDWSAVERFVAGFANALPAAVTGSGGGGSAR